MNVFISCDNWKTLFFTQSYCYPEVWCNRHIAAAFFKISVLEEARILSPLSPQQHCNAANIKDPKYSFYFLNFLDKCYLVIFTPSFCECFTFLYINEFFKIQKLPGYCFPKGSFKKYVRHGGQVSYEANENGGGVQFCLYVHSVKKLLDFSSSNKQSSF